MLFVQFLENEEHINQLEYDLEGSRADLQTKLKHISELEETVNDLQSELAQVKEQNNAALDEVGVHCLHISIWITVHGISFTYAVI